MSTESAGTAASGPTDRVNDRLLAEVFAVLLAEEGLEDLLQRVAYLAVELFPSCDVADVIVIREHKAITSGASDGRAFELHAAQSSGGPCADAYSRGRTCHVASIRTDTRWPRFTRIADPDSGFTRLWPSPSRSKKAPSAHCACIHESSHHSRRPMRLLVDTLSNGPPSLSRTLSRTRWPFKMPNICRGP